jgi:hypothetical protein
MAVRSDPKGKPRKWKYTTYLNKLVVGAVIFMSLSDMMIG